MMVMVVMKGALIQTGECTTTTGATKAELTAMAATMMNTVDIKENVTITGVFTTSQDDTKEESTTAITTMSTAIIWAEKTTTVSMTKAVAIKVEELLKC